MAPHKPEMSRNSPPHHTYFFLSFYFAVAPSKLEQPSYQSEAKGYQPEPQQTLAPEPVASYNTVPQQGYYLVCFSFSNGFTFVVLLDVPVMKMYFVFEGPHGHQIISFI